MSAIDSEDYQKWLQQFEGRADGTILGYRYLISDVAERLWAIDPSPDKRFIADLERWSLKSRGHIGYITDEPDPDYDSGIGLRKALALYYADPSLLDGLSEEKLQIAKRQVTRRQHRGVLGSIPLHQPPATPLAKYSYVDRFVNDVQRQMLRREHRQNAASNDVRDAEFIGSGQATLIHSAEYKIYYLKTREAHEAYAACKKEFYNRDIYQIETRDGARFTYEIGSLAISDEVGQAYGHTKIEKLFPNFFQIMKPEVLRTLAALDPEDLDYFKRRIALTRRYIDDWNDLVSLEEAIASFKSRYNIEKTEQEITSYREAAWDWTGVPAALENLMTFRGIEKAISGAEIRDIFVHLVKWRLHGTAQEFLAKIVTQKPWRESVTAEDIKPLFSNLSRAHSYAAKDMALAYLFTVTAQHPQWLTGEEASYLPQTLKYLSQTRRLPFRNSRKQPAVDPDWKRIKTLLRRAISFGPWREAIPPELLTEIGTQLGDNYVKGLGLPAIWERLAALRPGPQATSHSTGPKSP